jgi:hypothetical protein
MDSWCSVSLNINGKLFEAEGDPKDVMPKLEQFLASTSTKMDSVQRPGRRREALRK